MTVVLPLTPCKERDTTMPIRMPSGLTTSLLTGAGAGVLGVALLTSGGGTLAGWSDTASVRPGSIQSGTLDVALGSGAWTSPAGSPVDAATYAIVPGDVLTYSIPVDVTAEGDNLSATLTTNLAEVTDLSAGELAKYVTVDLSVTKDGVRVDDAGTVAIAPSSQVQRYVATAEVTFRADTEGQLGQGASFDLGQMNLMLTQVLPTTGN